MNTLMLALVLLLPTNTQITAYQTWDEISWQYRISPVVVTELSVASGLAAGNYWGLDRQGRARIALLPNPREIVRYTVAHEAAHALIDTSGQHPHNEESLAEAFGVCWVGRISVVISCSEVVDYFSRFHR